jgi:1,4-alpha-glucan branching enzyme
VIKRATSKGAHSVTFSLPGDDVPGAVSVVGDFNDWDPAAHPLRKRSNGTRSVKVDLPPGTYRFKYLLEGGDWRNDDEADRLEANEWGEVDSVIDVAPGG